jgi:hypothetical protein
MGTRHFIGVIADGKYKIANYGQWDGYPSGQGAGILNFLSKADMTIFKDKLNHCRYVEQTELRQFYVNAGDDPNNTSGWVDSRIADRFKNMYPSLSRDTGSNILNIVYDSCGVVPLWNSESFLDDELFCEFAYIIDVDNGTLRCYMNGKKNVFGEYIFEDLPSLSDMEYDYGQLCKRLYGEEEEE